MGKYGRGPYAAVLLHAEHTVSADRIFGQLLGILEDRTADVGSAPSPFAADQCLTALAHFRRCAKHLARRLEEQIVDAWL